MTMNERLSQLVGKKVKVYLAGALVLKGKLEKFYYRDNYHYYAIRKDNNYIRSIACCDVLSVEEVK